MCNVAIRLLVDAGMKSFIPFPLVETSPSVPWLTVGCDRSQASTEEMCFCSQRCSAGRRDCSCLSAHFPVWNIYNPDSIFQALCSEQADSSCLLAWTSTSLPSQWPDAKGKAGEHHAWCPPGQGIHPEGGGCKLKCIWAGAPVLAGWIRCPSLAAFFFLRK